MKTVGIAGAGTIGKAVIQRLARGDAGASVVAVSARDEARTHANLGRLASELEFLPLSRLPDRCDIVVEAMPASMFSAIAEPAIERGRIFMPLSVGALLARMDLVERAKQTGARIVVPTGALLGLDAVRAAAEGEIKHATIITRKPPKSLAGAPYFELHPFALDDLTEAVCVFAGSARDGAAGFPANVNVAAALSLAGIGPDRTRLEIWADPAVDRNTHTVSVESDSTRFTMTIESTPFDENPRTGKLTPLSVVAAIRGLTSTLRIGS